MKADSRDRVRALNDAFRRNLEGGRVALSSGIAALPAVVVFEIIEAVRSFDRFDADNDPHGGTTSARSTSAASSCSGRSIATTARCAGTRPTPAMRR